MGWGPDAPKPPDPQQTAAAQTSTNVSTAIANSWLGNINQVTPDGSLTFDQTGSKFIDDKNGTKYWVDAKGNYTTTDPGKNSKGYTQKTGYYLPTLTATQTLSENQKAIKDQTDKASLNLASLANSQSGRLNDLLATPFNMNGLPAGADPSKLQLPQYQQYGNGPQLQTSVGNTGNIQNSIAGAGNIQRGVGNTGNIQTSIGNAGDITKSYGTDYGANVQQVQDALMARQQPYLDQDRKALETKLANQGIQIGSAAYDAAMESANKQVNDARYGAILNAGQEQSRLAGLAQQQAAFQNAAQQQQYSQLMGSGQFANSAQAQQYQQAANNMQMGNAAQQQQFAQNQAQQQANNSAQQQAYQQAMANAQLNNSSQQQMYQNQNTAISGNNALKDQSFNAELTRNTALNQQRQQALQEAYAARNQPLNEISALMSGGQVSNPNFMNIQGTQMPTVDMAGLINSNYQNQMAAYQSQMGGLQNIFGGLMGLGSSFIMGSDRNMKKDITKVGEVQGENIYRFRYKSGGPFQLGVMAQEVKKDHPDAVSRRPDGYLQVDYGKVFGLGKRAA